MDVAGQHGFLLPDVRVIGLVPGVVLAGFGIGVPVRVIAELDEYPGPRGWATGLAGNASGPRRLTRHLAYRRKPHLSASGHHYLRIVKFALKHAAKGESD